MSLVCRINKYLKKIDFTKNFDFCCMNRIDVLINKHEKIGTQILRIPIKNTII